MGAHIQRRTGVKICGLTRPLDASLAEAAGADYLGVVLASGPRLLDQTRAREVLGRPRAGIQRTAVFGSQRPEEIIALVQSLELDVAQLHGDFTPAEVRRIARGTGRPVWPVLRVAGTTVPPDAAELGDAAGWLVLDAHVVGQLGGTGVALDWSGLAASVASLRRELPALRLVLAGGLRSTNVRQAIELLAPDVVDVSSGVESAPGVKDPVAMEQFVSAVRTATESGA